MASKVTFTSSSGKDPDRSLMDFFDVLPKPEQMIRAATNQIARIKERTAVGTSFTGQTFAPYSRTYAKQRAKEGLQIAPPNLRKTGRLLNSLQSQVLSPTQFAITITDGRAQMYGPANSSGSGRLPSRKFFSTNYQELAHMIVDLKKGD